MASYRGEGGDFRVSDVAIVAVIVGAGYFIYKTVGQGISTATQGLGGGIAQVGTAAGTVAGDIAQVTGGAADTITSGLGNASGFLRGAQPGTAQAGQNVGNTLANISNIPKTATAATASIVNDVSGTASNLISNITGSIKNTANTFFSNVQPYLNPVTLVSKAISFEKNAVSNLVSTITTKTTSAAITQSTAKTLQTSSVSTPTTKTAVTQTAQQMVNATAISNIRAQSTGQLKRVFA